MVAAVVGKVLTVDLRGGILTETADGRAAGTVNHGDF